MVAYRAHTPGVAGSSPATATNFDNKGNDILISCKQLADITKENIKNTIKESGYQPSIAIISNNKPEGARYIRNKVKVAEEVGIKATVYDVDDFSTEEIKKFISILKEDAIILQLPFRTKAVSDEIIASIPVKKDVDGLHGDIVTPATALGVFEYLKTNNLIEGKNITILGRSNLVGKPLAKLLLDTNATVTMCHTKTNDINNHIKNADVIVSAVGKIDMITIDHLDPSKEYHIVDVGINFDSDGKICGDVSKLVNSDKVITTPVPGGVGLLTTAFLMSNVLKLCLRDK